jgi:hypothetical protein
MIDATALLVDRLCVALLGLRLIKAEVRERPGEHAALIDTEPAQVGANQNVPLFSLRGRLTECVLISDSPAPPFHRRRQTYWGVTLIVPVAVPSA